MTWLITPRFIYRRPFALVAAVSTLLCLVVIGCWVFSLFAAFGQGWNTSLGGNAEGYKIRLWAAEGGSLQLLRRDMLVTPMKPVSSGHSYHGGYDPVGRLMLRLIPTRFGFAYLNQTSGFRDQTGRQHTFTSSQVSIPLWLPALLLALPPAAWLLARRRRRGQLLRGICVGCGYDLRATPRRCPECGLEAPGAA